MRTKLKTMLAMFTLVFALAAGSAQAASPVMDYWSYIYNNDSYLEAEAYTSYEGCDGEWWECQLYQAGVEMTVYEDNVQIWNSMDVSDSGSSWAVVSTIWSIPVDSSKAYRSTAYHWSEGSYFSWGTTTTSSF
ncbi:hypothetical protein ACFQ88_35720 [Paenibacillus sp. NPDC056579]|uniref:hypothetical protein n=1 Tax=Paenibacillus sp. NPDC056579 TaxID=3345871 RepID=UPI00369012A7